MSKVKEYIDEIQTILIDNTGDLRLDLDEITRINEREDGLSEIEESMAFEDGQNYIVYEKNDAFILIFEEKKIYLCFNIDILPHIITELVLLFARKFSKSEMIEEGNDYIWKDDELLFGSEANKHRAEIYLQYAKNKVQCNCEQGKKTDTKITYH